MRVLHSALMLHAFPGIIGQMRFEQAAARELGLQWTTKIFAPGSAGTTTDANEIFQVAPIGNAPGKSLAARFLFYIKFRQAYYRWLLAKASQVDVLLLRYSTSDPFQYLFLKQCKKPVFLVHHTLGIAELRAIGGLGSQLRIAVEHLFIRLSNDACHGVIGVTDEIAAAYGNNRERRYCYANGMYYSSQPADKCLTTTDGLPSLAFVAGTFSPWHGLDLLLNTLSTSSAQFELHLVGELGDAELAVAKADPRVRIHGRLTAGRLATLLSSCDIGLSSFALDRNGMVEACPLKTREYLAIGLPVYSGHRDVFPADFPWYRVGPPSIDAAVAFAIEIRQHSRVKTTVARDSRRFIDKVKLVSELHDWLVLNSPSGLAAP